MPPREARLEPDWIVWKAVGLATSPGGAKMMAESLRRQDPGRYMVRKCRSSEHG